VTETVQLKRLSNQFIKFAFVGLFNTALTALTIWILLQQFHFSNYFSNIVGFIIGLTNSFIWNRRWTFESTCSIRETLIKFSITFAICYMVQLVNLYLLLHYTDLEPFICQFISIGIYTLLNFTLNKTYTFKS
jgi:putative flippase GtrA